MSQLNLHPVRTGSNVYVDVILPLALNKAYTYWVPEELVPVVRQGMRVEVPFGKRRLYTGLVLRLHSQQPEYSAKAILSVIDEQAIVTEHQLKLWQWMANYYVTSLGEVMNAALPAGFKLSSETRVTLGPLFHREPAQFDDREYLIVEALSIQEELSVADIQSILGIKTVYPIIRRLLDKRIIYLKEDLREKYTPKRVKCVRMLEPFASQPNEAFAQVTRSERQENMLLAYLQMSRQQEFIRQADLVKATGTDYSVIKALEKKHIFEVYEREVSRLGSYEEDTVDASELSDQQVGALAEIKRCFEQQAVVLLHGVTGSGKTRVYLELIQEVIARGGQVLYLLPEIALTTQIIQRVQRVLGDDIAVYHSRLNHNERVEQWQAIMAGQSAVLGPRSALFLPFRNLELVIVDEEHDPSYKQREPNPRYQGRDTAIMLAQLHQAKVLLGTATPAVETYHNVQQGKYGLVRMNERFGGIALPEIIIADMQRERQEQTLYNHFTGTLLDALKAALVNNEQAILFQNRRGYAPTLRCPSCGWHAECINCDVSLTLHKFKEQLQCHYCGYST
ncbi:MAG: primosomal protein N', partial [Bacteroidetes bacterium]